jgi:hypothetical protein
MKPFRVYRNLHKGNFSIQSYVEEKQGYRVTDRASSVMLEDCRFKIYESGRQNVIKEKRKSVHAYVEPMSYNHFKNEVDVSKFREIYYNPYKYDSFVYKDNLEKANKVNRVLAYNNKLYDVSDELV